VVDGWSSGNRGDFCLGRIIGDGKMLDFVTRS
jgi:hypothetical protein